MVVSCEYACSKKGKKFTALLSVYIASQEELCTMQGAGWLVMIWYG
jgi:hypothetical protein